MFAPSVTGSDRSTTTRSGWNVATAAIRDRSSATMPTVSNSVSNRLWTPSSMFKWESATSTRPDFMTGRHLNQWPHARPPLAERGALVAVQPGHVGQWGRVSQELTRTQLAELRDLGCALRNAGQREMFSWRMAYWTSSAVVWMPRAARMRARRNSAVRGEIFRIDATSLAERTSARSCKTSRWRRVNREASSGVRADASRYDSNNSPATIGDTYVWPRSASRSAVTSSDGAECFRTKPDAPASRARRA